MRQEEADNLDNWFTYHSPPDQTTVLHYQEIRESGKDFAEYLFNEVPDCRERSLALIKIREAVMWANAAIACTGEKKVR